VGLLFAFKILHPQRVWLVRGNHEDRFMNEKYGFKGECLRKLGVAFGQKTYDLIQSTFDRLPMACLIAEKVLVVHGGIGDGKWKLDDLLTIQRPLSADTLARTHNKWLYNILWSDPIEDDAGDELMFGVHESPRGGTAHRFAWNITKNFCALNGLGLVVRSHQVKRNGMGYSMMHDNMLVRVFSARDYEGHGNDAAVIWISPSGEKGELLTVRAQVLCSLTKAREAESRRAAAETATRSPEAAPAAAGADRAMERAEGTPEGATTSRASSSSSSERRRGTSPLRQTRSSGKSREAAKGRGRGRGRTGPCRSAGAPVQRWPT